MNYILKNIFDEMERQGISQRSMADRLNVSQGLIASWKSERIDSYKKKLPEIAAILGVSIEFLLGKKSSEATHLFRRYSQATEKEKRVIEEILKDYD